jgi:hypothetical protein
METKSEKLDLVGDDLLRGATAIAAHLRSVGLSDVDAADVYYFAKAKKLPIGKFGKELIASKARLTRDLRHAARAPPSTQT